MARIGSHRRAIELEEGEPHFAARRRGPGQGDERAGDRPSAPVGIAIGPDEAGFLHILAGDIEAEDGTRQVPAGTKDRQKLVSSDDLAAGDAVEVDQDEIEGGDLRVGGEEGFGFGNVGGFGRAGGEVAAHAAALRSARRPRTVAKASTRPSACFSESAGLTSTILWKGVSR